MSGCLKKEALLALADREWPSGDMELAERHIAVCLSCKQELESIRATNLKVNSLLSSLAPEESGGADAIAIVRIPYSGANVRMRWTAVASVGVLVAALLLFVMIRRQHPSHELNVVEAVTSAPLQSVGKKEVLTATVAKTPHVGATKTAVKMRQFQALDNGEPIESGMIYRVNLPASTFPNVAVSQSAKRIPAEVIVDEFGKVRAIRFLQ
jgi:hypothetical protein